MTPAAWVLLASLIVTLPAVVALIVVLSWPERPRMSPQRDVLDGMGRAARGGGR